MSRIIAICGLMRSGKDTVADYLCTKWGYEKLRIADTLKKTMHLLFGFSTEQLEGDHKDAIDPSWGISPRQAMQFFGTEVMQYHVQKLLPDVGRTFWIASLVSQLRSKPKDKIYVIPDLRFVHEYDYLKSNFGQRVHVIKIVNPNIKYCESHLHNSEQEYKNIREDFCILNNEDLTSLYQKVDVVLSQIESRDGRASD